jgi:hypothetical protein
MTTLLYDSIICYYTLNTVYICHLLSVREALGERVISVALDILAVLQIEGEPIILVKRNVMFKTIGEVGLKRKRKKEAKN